VANVYGRELDPLDLFMIAGVSTAAGFISVNVSGVRSLTAGGFVLGYLGLPIEAVLPAFIVLEVICEGLRNVLSILLSGALLALVSYGLPSQAAKPEAAAAAAPAEQLRFVVTRGRAAVVALLVAFAMSASYLAGLGFGMRRADGAKAPLMPDLRPMLNPNGARSVKP
jgi:aerobic C4-dicarboxylate transport protein